MTLQNSPSQRRQATTLVVTSVLGVVIGYATSILVARTLGADGFEDYAVAVSAAMFLATFCEAGAGKYAFRVLPVFVKTQQHDLASGYWKFSFRLVLLLSGILGAASLAAEFFSDGELGNYPLGVAAIFLPAIAMAGTSVDFVTATGRAVSGAVVARVVAPTASLVAILLASRQFPQAFDSNWAIGCFGFGSAVAATSALTIFRVADQTRVFSQTPAFRLREWGVECVAYLVLGLLMAWLFRVSIVILEALPIAESSVASFAAALETSCLILLFSKSTDKYFQPYMSTILETGDWATARRMRRARTIYVGICCLNFLGFMVVFGKSLLGVFGKEFQSGYAALILCSTGTCTWTMFSLAPYFLKFSGSNRFVYGTLTIGAVTLAALTSWLGGMWGETGAGIAFCVVLVAISLAFLVRANVEVARRMEEAADYDEPTHPTT